MLIYFVFLELVSLFGVQKSYKLYPFYKSLNFSYIHYCYFLDANFFFILQGILRQI